MTLPEIPKELHDLNVRWGDVTVEQAWVACYAAALRHAADRLDSREDYPVCDEDPPLLLRRMADEATARVLPGLADAARRANRMEHRD